MKKLMRRLLAVVAALTMVLGMSVSAFAAAPQTATDGTITLSNAAIGKEYKAYKILDATYDGNAVAYTTDATHKAVLSATGSPFTVAENPDGNENYAVTSTATAAQISEWIKTNLSSFTAISATEGVDTKDVATATTVKWTGLHYGYYYITSGLGSEVTITSAVKDAPIVDKNTTEPTKPEKTADKATYQIGDTASFTVKFNGSNSVTKKNDDGTVTTNKVTEYDITDTPTGYDINANSLKVTVGETDVTSTITGNTVDQTTGKLTFTLPWVNAQEENIYAEGAEVVITYTGTVNSDAFAGKATNTVDVKNNVQPDAKTDTHETTNYNLTINKTDGTNPLKGAKFELYRGNATTAISLIKLNAPATGTEAANTVYYRVAEANENSATTTIDMSDASSAVINGLDGASTYKAKEIQAPAGYNLKTDTTDATLNNQNATVTVQNNKGSVLPSTGGIGTTIFYVLGAALVIGAGVVLVTRRRLSK